MDDSTPLKLARDFVDWEGIYAQGPARAMEVLAELSSLEDNDFTLARLALVGSAMEEEQARHRPGAQARAASTLGLSPQRMSQLYRQYRKKYRVTRIAYDFGDELHIMDLDGQGVAIEGSVETAPAPDGPDQALVRAGYRRSGPWERHGEAMGATVEKVKTEKEKHQ